MYIIVPNFIKIGQAVAKTTFLKMTAIRHLGFLKVSVFEQPLMSRGPICTILQNFVKIGQTVLEIS